MQLSMFACSILFVCFLLTLLVINAQDDMRFSFQESSPNWFILKSSNGIKFTARNAHATCLFNGRIYVTGGKTDLYEMFNTLYSYKVADVWWSLDGADWVQEIELKGDFYAQNADAFYPSKLAPWYTRFGHTLSPIDLDDDGVDDMMIQLGGFAPGPTNDIWITLDGITWVYCGFAPWEARGWHSAVKYQKKLYIIGGSPLNNEVWVLVGNPTSVPRRTPNTRAMYMDYTYDTTWSMLGNADWSPRCGMNVVSQYFYRAQSPYNETIANSTERMVFISGFGGWLEGDMRFDGYRSRSDVWDSYDGVTWNMITDDAFPPRAWHTSTVLYQNETRLTVDVAVNARLIEMPPRIVVIGGGYIGGSTFNTKITTAVNGWADAWFSFDGQIWQKVNYEQGRGIRKYDTFVQYYSSQEWTNTIVDSKVNYLGMWGSTTVWVNGKFILIAGDKTGAGPLQSTTFLALDGILCDLEGIICSNAGTCTGGFGGCECDGGFEGLYCENDLEALALEAASPGGGG